MLEITVLPATPVLSASSTCPGGGSSRLKGVVLHDRQYRRLAAEHGLEIIELPRSDVAANVPGLVGTILRQAGSPDPAAVVRSSAWAPGWRRPDLDRFLLTPVGPVTPLPPSALGRVTLANALADGASVDATASFHAEWQGGGRAITIGDGLFRATVVEDRASIRWSAPERGFAFISDESTTSVLQCSAGSPTAASCDYEGRSGLRARTGLSLRAATTGAASQVPG